MKFISFFQQATQLWYKLTFKIKPNLDSLITQTLFNQHQKKIVYEIMRIIYWHYHEYWVMDMYAIHKFTPAQPNLHIAKKKSECSITITIPFDYIPWKINLFQIILCCLHQRSQKDLDHHHHNYIDGGFQVMNFRPVKHKQNHSGQMR